MRTAPAPTPGSGPRPLPKIELHVHLEGAVRPETLLRLARRNGVTLPASDAAALASLYRFRDFAHFIDLWTLTTAAIQTAADFREIVIAYATEAATHGAVYIEGIFTPVERAAAGLPLEAVFAGFCDGAAEAEERTGVRVGLTIDIPWGSDPDEARATVAVAGRFRDQGVVGVGLGGREAIVPASVYATAFAAARDAGLGVVPHAGEAAGPASVRSCLEALQPDRLRHGIRAAEDPGLLAELAGRGIVCDVCPTSNLATGVVASLAAHPLPRLLAAGVACTLNTDDPAMFATDLSREHAIAAALGCDAEQAFRAGVAGALCDEATRAELEALAARTDWATTGADAGSLPTLAP